MPCINSAGLMKYTTNRYDLRKDCSVGQEKISFLSIWNITFKVETVNSCHFSLFLYVVSKIRIGRCRWYKMILEGIYTFVYYQVISSNVWHIE